METSNSLFDCLWQERYRPETLDDMVLELDVKDYFRNAIKTGEIPHILLIGDPGIGKTSLAKVIVSELQCSYRYINASDKRGIDDIRSEVINFAQTKSFDGKMKIVILDECDSMSGDSSRCLRNVMEEYSDNVRFILTGNYRNRIIKPIISRCIVFELNPPIKAINARVIDIIQKENITVTEDQTEKLKELIKNNYPDIRSIIKMLQRCTKNGVLNITSINTLSLDIARKIFDSIQSKTEGTKIRQYIIENEVNFNNDYHDLLKSLFEVYFTDETLTEERKRMALILIGDYMYKHQFVMDFEINMFCCVLQLLKF